MTALALQCDSYYEAPATPPSAAAYELSALAPFPSPAELLRESRRQTMEELLNAAIEDEVDGANSSAVRNFVPLLRLLPREFGATEPRIAHDGAICLDWDKDPENLFSIILLDFDRIAFAAYLSGEKVHGTADFLPEALPVSLSQAAKRWIERVSARS
jgi:hypothetical protein